jgi:hypothetical protein
MQVPLPGASEPGNLLAKHGQVTTGRPRAVGGIASTGEITVEMISRTFRQWRVFEQRGTWWATRGGLQVWDGPRSLLLRVITAPDLTALADRLCLQEWLDSLGDDELEAVYRGDVLPCAPARVANRGHAR